MDGESVCENNGFLLGWVIEKRSGKSPGLGIRVPDCSILLSELSDTNILGFSLPLRKMRGSESQDCFPDSNKNYPVW